MMGKGGGTCDIICAINIVSVKKLGTSLLFTMTLNFRGPFLLLSIVKRNSLELTECKPTTRNGSILDRVRDVFHRF